MAAPATLPRHLAGGLGCSQRRGASGRGGGVRADGGYLRGSAITIPRSYSAPSAAGTGGASRGGSSKEACCTTPSSVSAAPAESTTAQTRFKPAAGLAATYLAFLEAVRVVGSGLRTAVEARGGLGGFLFGQEGGRFALAGALATLSNLTTLLATTSGATARVAVQQHVTSPIMSNTIFMAGFWGWFIAQFLKIFTARYKKGYWSLKAFTDAGGMPSSHSSLCMAVTASVGITEGLGSPLFAMALCFSLIVMYDAAGVRRHAGKQAEVLNVVGKAVLERELQLKEVLGHTPFQVVVGALLGTVIGTLYAICL